MEVIGIMIQGLLMAMADSVPGVSGSTIAFILGYYERFMSALHDLFGKDNSLRMNAILYLIKFGCGWALGMVGSILILSSLFSSYVYQLSSLFLGLTLAALPFILYEEKDVIKGNWSHLLFTLIGAGLVIFLTWLRSSDIGLGNVDFLHINVSGALYLLVSGFVAICAMLLPGMSGSSVLLIFGLYLPVINAVKEILHFHLAYIIPVGLLGIGVLLGVVLASKSIKQALVSHRSMMIYLIAGLMLGSLYAISYGPTTLDIPQAPLSLSSFKILFFIIGILILVGMEFYKHKKQS